MIASVIVAAVAGILIGMWLRGAGAPLDERYEPPAVIQFSRATLCLDCDCLTESTNDHCVHCHASGGSLLRLGTPLSPLRVTNAKRS